MRKSSLPLLTFLAACGALFLAGCGESDSSPAVNEGAASQIRSQLPPDFPKDVPVYPGLNEADVTSLGDGFEVSGSADDSLEKIDAYYVEFFDDEGWARDETLSDNSLPDARVYHYTKGDRGITVVAGREGTKIAIETNYRTQPLY